jgi:hypothetical protein
MRGDEGRAKPGGYISCVKGRVCNTRHRESPPCGGTRAGQSPANRPQTEPVILDVHVQDLAVTDARDDKLTHDSLAMRGILPRVARDQDNPAIFRSRAGEARSVSVRGNKKGEPEGARLFIVSWTGA